MSVIDYVGGAGAGAGADESSLCGEIQKYSIEVKSRGLFN